MAGGLGAGTGVLVGLIIGSWLSLHHFVQSQHFEEEDEESGRKVAS